MGTCLSRTPVTNAIPAARSSQPSSANAPLGALSLFGASAPRPDPAYGDSAQRTSDDMSKPKGQAYVTTEEVDDSPGTLEHISEREDFSAHEERLRRSMLPSSAKTSPSFRRSTASPDRRSSAASPDGRGREDAHEPRLRKANSTSTIFIDSTVSAPNLEDTLQCVALALHLICCDGHEQENPLLFPSKFDEKLFPLTEHRVPGDYATRIPGDDEIYIFLKRLFHSAVLSAECGIISLVYINRAIAYTNLALHASNWKRVVLGAVLMASKVWDDQAVWNVDFCTIFPKVKVDDMNELERTYLEMLQFNINVESSVYAKYYFELRSLAERNNKNFPLEPLTIDGATRLEAMSEKQEDHFRKQSSLRNAKSLDAKTFSSKAVLN